LAPGSWLGATQKGGQAGTGGFQAAATTCQSSANNSDVQADVCACLAPRPSTDMSCMCTGVVKIAQQIGWPEASTQPPVQLMQAREGRAYLVMATTLTGLGDGEALGGLGDRERRGAG
jgi:hypothetical protein